MKKGFLVLVLFTVLSLFICAYQYSVVEDLKNNVIRLHILAASDSDYDQSVKLAVRDAVLSATRSCNISDTDVFLANAKAAANEYLAENNIPYSADAEFGEFKFPKKTYDNITLPEGTYRGVRILLGNAEGRNWWCVMYPPLCVAEKNAAARHELKASLRDDTYAYITKKPQVRLKLAEVFRKIGN